MLARSSCAGCCENPLRLQQMENQPVMCRDTGFVIADVVRVLDDEALIVCELITLHATNQFRSEIFHHTCSGQKQKAIATLTSSHKLYTIHAELIK